MKKMDLRFIRHEQQRVRQTLLWLVELSVEPDPDGTGCLRCDHSLSDHDTSEARTTRCGFPSGREDLPRLCFCDGYVADRKMIH